MTTIAYVANTNVLELVGLKSEVEDAFITDATVEVTVKDHHDVEVEGATWPLAMNYVEGTDATYRAILPDGLSLDHNYSYVAIIDADAGQDRIGHWEVTFRAQTRT